MEVPVFRMNTPLFGKMVAIEETPQRWWKHPGAWHDSDRTAAMRDDITLDGQQKLCAVCGTLLARREGERPHLFRKRKTCGGSCATELGLRSRPSRKGIPLLGNRKPIVVKTCEYCSRAYTPCHRKQRYCSHACGNTGSRKPMPMVSCATCGTTFEPIRGNKARQFCSKRCAYDARIGIPARNKMERVQLFCRHCGNPFSVIPSQAKRADRKYCSLSCRALAVLRERPRGATTWIEDAVHVALGSLGIEFQTQVKIGRYRVDVLIPSASLVIECFGDFWHCNPADYPDGPIYEAHRKQPERDQRRVSWLRTQGYRVAVFWEKDIESFGAPALVAQAIREAV